MRVTADVLGTLLTRRWLTGLAIATVFALAAVLLGNWQYAKHQDRVAARDRLEAHYSAEVTALRDVLPGPGSDLPPELGWSRVQATGHYAADQQLLVRNRPHSGVYGYEVLVPLVLADGGAVLVDRGWVPNAADATTLPEVPPPPEGQVTVTGWLRPTEPDLDRDLPEGQVASVSTEAAGERTGMAFAPAYLLLQSEDDGSGTPPERPLALPEPDTGLGAHFAYALQWWLTAPLGFAMVIVFARREHLEARGEGRERVASGRVPRRPRIWDEEDE